MHDFYKPVEQEPITLRGEWKKLRKMGFRDGESTCGINYTAAGNCHFLLIVLVAIIGSSIYQRTPRLIWTLGLIDYDGYSEYLEGEDIATEDGSTGASDHQHFSGDFPGETIAWEDSRCGHGNYCDGCRQGSGRNHRLRRIDSASPEKFGDYFYDLEEQFGENELAMLQDRLLYAWMRTEWSIR